MCLISSVANPELSLKGERGENFVPWLFPWVGIQ